MKINVFIERFNKNETVEADSLEDALKKLDINPETVIIVRDNKLITLNVGLKDNDSIKLLSVISGG